MGMEMRLPSCSMMILFMTGLAVMRVLVVGFLTWLPKSSSMPMSAKSSMKKAMYGSFSINCFRVFLSSSLPM